VVSYLAGQDVNSQVLQKAMADPSSDSVWSTVLSWRRLLQATAALSVKVSMPAILGRAAVQAGGSDSLPLRGGEILPDPDFSLLSPKHPYLIGIRPHRVGGVRLETKISTPLSPRFFPSCGKPGWHHRGEAQCNSSPPCCASSPCAVCVVAR
jgi:hypothetical protein